MNSFPEPTPYQRHEWNTCVCLLWHGARVELPSEPNPYQTQTSHPRSARRLASRDVRSTECMFLWGDPSSLWPACWLGTQTLVSLKSTPDNDTATLRIWESGDSTGRHSGTQKQPYHCVISGFFYRLAAVQGNYTFIAFCNCEWMHVSSQLNGVKCVRLSSPVHRQYVLVSFLLCDSKLNIFELWTKQDIWGRRLGHFSPFSDIN